MQIVLENNEYRSQIKNHNTMKNKLLSAFHSSPALAVMFLFLLLIQNSAFSQNQFFVKDTAGAVPKRLTYLESSNVISNAQYITIIGSTSAEIQFSFGDSLFTKNTAIAFADKILIASCWMRKYATEQIWFKSTTGTVNLNIMYRAW